MGINYEQHLENEYYDWLNSAESKFSINDAFHFAFEAAYVDRQAGYTAKDYLKSFNLIYLDDDLNWGIATSLVAKYLFFTASQVTGVCQ